MSGTLLLARNGTAPDQPQWNSKGMFELPEWAEPVMVLLILSTSMFMTRRKSFSIFGSRHGYRALPYDSTDPDSARSSDDLLWYDVDNDTDSQESLASTKALPKKRSIGCGLSITTPNTTRFSSNLHSRILQKFPFLIEMFYWIITYLFYRMTKVVSAAIFEQDKLIAVAQDNALRILWVEQDSPFAFLFPTSEHSVQQYFMQDAFHQAFLTFLNRFYALCHIPGTVGFIAWYYYIAPNFDLFSTARRTLTLTNLFAFITFTLMPTMPPRLLPKEYGFLDTVRHDNAQSIFMRGDAVNSLAAMPSMHFGYAFCIGSTLIYHSGIFRRTLVKGEVRKTLFWKIFYLAIAVGYPLTVLTAIVATANHYWLDAVVAVFVALLAYCCNTVFLVLLPVEDCLLWMLRVSKPIPSTGERFHVRAGRI